MQPRAYVIVFALVLGLAVPAWLGLVAVVAGVPTVSSAPLCALLAEKRRIARALASSGPRLFLVAGSSTHFGISAAQIEAALGRPTINYGNNGALSLDMMLGDVRRLARPGDWVLLVPEYSHYDRAAINSVLVDYLLACAVDALPDLPLAQRVEAVFAPSPLRLGAGIAARLGFEEAAEALAYLNQPLPLGEHYVVDVKIGPRGDGLVNRRAAITPKLRGRVADFRPLPLSFRPDSDGPKALAAFASWALAHEVRVLVTWPNTLRFDAYGEAAAQDFFRRVTSFYGDLAVPVLGTPEAAMFAAEDFYDTNYHLHDEAVARRTGALVPLLRAALAVP
jgi:hypothetical protein